MGPMFSGSLPALTSPFKNETTFSPNFWLVEVMGANFAGWSCRWLSTTATIFSGSQGMQVCPTLFIGSVIGMIFPCGGTPTSKTSCIPIMSMGIVWLTSTIICLALCTTASMHPIEAVGISPSSVKAVHSTTATSISGPTCWFTIKGKWEICISSYFVFPPLMAARISLLAW